MFGINVTSAISNCSTSLQEHKGTWSEIWDNIEMPREGMLSDNVDKLFNLSFFSHVQQITTINEFSRM